MDGEPEAVEGHGLLLRFDTDDVQFARGFELGRLWVMARSGQEVRDEFVCAENAEMVLRMAEATGRRVSAELLDDDWMSVTFGPASESLEADGL